MKELKDYLALLVVAFAAMVIVLGACVGDPRTGAIALDPVTGVTDPTKPAPSPSALPTPDPTASAMQQEVFDRTNAYRVQNGVAPLTWNSKLAAAAQGHAESMATNGYFSHTGIDGSSGGTRISAQGYSWRTWGENIAYGYTTAEVVMTGWINSPGHRANILSSNFKELGVGYAVRSDGTAYWVQDFGAQ